MERWCVGLESQFIEMVTKWTRNFLISRLLSERQRSSSSVVLDSRLADGLVLCVYYLVVDVVALCVGTATGTRPGTSCYEPESGTKNSKREW